MSGASASFSPRYVRLSGEIADQAELDGLARASPHASIEHAYASPRPVSALVSTTGARVFLPG
ncbi:hypothetical protein ACVMAJ_001405 [Bradyrhizobium sp. USDA 4448]